MPGKELNRMETFSAITCLYPTTAKPPRFSENLHQVLIKMSGILRGAVKDFDSRGISELFMVVVRHTYFGCGW